jgi:hypothetical protein
MNVSIFYRLLDQNIQSHLTDGIEGLKVIEVLSGASKI